MVDVVEARAPGFRDSIVGRVVTSPEQTAADLRWARSHPMHLDTTLDQLGPFRPIRALARHTTPVQELFTTGAGTAPVGGIAGTPGRAAAKALLRTERSTRGRRR